jgi:phage tail protein X
MGRYTSTKITTYENKQGYETTIYPEIQLSAGDFYVYTTIGDRFDVLAQQFYGDSSLWWIIARGNAGIQGDSLACPVGIQIRIPANPTQVIAALKTT